MAGQSAMLSLAEAKRIQERICWGGNHQGSSSSSTVKSPSKETYRKGGK